MIRIDRLKQLRNFVVNESPKVFDFSTWNSKVPIYKKMLGETCGTSGCLLGNAPLVWKEWGYEIKDKDNTKGPAPRLKGTDLRVLESAVEWFGTSRAQTEHIFQIKAQLNDFGNSPYLKLNREASLKDALTVLDNFILWAEAKQNPQGQTIEQILEEVAK